MKILAKCKVIKLREYSQSYGAPETIEVDFIVEHDNKIELLDNCSSLIRTMKKGTKLLIDFSGTEISERAFKIRTNKAKKIHKINLDEIKVKEEKERAEMFKRIDSQKKQLIDFFSKNPDKKQKFADTIKNNSSKFWRGKVKLMACKIVTKDFGTFELTPPIIREIVFN